MIDSWLIYTAISCLLYGLWGFFSKVTTNYIEPESALVYQAIGAMLVGLFVLCRSGFNLQANNLGIFYAILVGFVATFASLFFLLALSKGKVAMVVTLTGLYPLISIILAFFILKEPISIRQGVSILLALAAIALFSWSE